jgi:putative YjhG/YagF family dehydratase
MSFELFAPLSEGLYEVQTRAEGPPGRLPLTDAMLRHWPSGDLFGLTQNAGMGWPPAELGRKQFLILSTVGGLRAADGTPLALGYHTGHWEIGLQVREVAEAVRRLGCIPFAAYCSDPCDGRTQGTPGMFDSLPYRNDAAQVFRRLARSLPTRSGVIGVATCDKGLPAMMMALAGCGDRAGAIVPGGVTLPPVTGEDAGTIQSMGARYAHGLLSLDEAAEWGCRACGTPGGGCQFLGTAATSQVIAEALGLAVPHSALAPSGQAVWLEAATRTACAVVRQETSGLRMADFLSEAGLRNAMVVHAAVGGSTNLLLHLPAIAHAAKLPRPTVEDWIAVNQRVPRIVSVLPNGPIPHPTVRVFLAGGVPEIMLQLRPLGVLDESVLTASGVTLREVLDAWEISERRARFRQRLQDADGILPSDVIMSPDQARRSGLASTLIFPRGNLAPEGAVIKSTALDPAVLDSAGNFHFAGPARVFVREATAIEALKLGRIRPGDVVVLAGAGPLGTGMEETYQLTSALKHLPVGKHVALITDARFSGVSTGACIGHVGPEALAGGPIGKLRDEDWVVISLDRQTLEGRVDFLGEGGERFDASEGARRLVRRLRRTDLAPHPALPSDTRLWAALQAASGGTWGGCVYDVESIVARLERAPG